MPETAIKPDLLWIVVQFKNGSNVLLKVPPLEQEAFTHDFRAGEKRGASMTPFAEDGSPGDGIQEWTFQFEDIAWCRRVNQELGQKIVDESNAAQAEMRAAQIRQRNGSLR